MRRVYFIDHPKPATAEEQAAIDASGATEVVFNADTTGYQEIEPPNPPRRKLPKSTVQERVEARGKWEAVVALLFTNGLPNINYGRWFAPDHPEVYADDERMLGLLMMAGCTEGEIAEITAP